MNLILYYPNIRGTVVRNDSFRSADQANFEIPILTYSTCQNEGTRMKKAVIIIVRLEGTS